MIERSRAILGIPADYRIGILPASDTGAFECAMWSLLGARGVDVVAFESFGDGWLIDIEKQLKLADARALIAPYGALPDLGQVDPARDTVFCWNGTTSGVRIPNGAWIADDRSGLTLCDATSAAFAMELPWQKLDVVTWSWQKVLGGEAQHGMLVLSPRAVERLESYKPAWPLPKLFRLTKGGKLIEGIFKGETINTPSMLAVEDALDGLRWAESIGGLPGADRPLRAQSRRHRRLGRAQRLGRVPRRVARDPLADLGLPRDPRRRLHGAVGGRPAGVRQGHDRAAGRAEGRLRHPELPRCPGGPADLVRRHGRDVRRRGTAALARLGLRRDPRPARLSRPRPNDPRGAAMPRVLIADQLSPAAEAIFRERGLEVDTRVGMKPAELIAAIGDYDGLAIRSATKVTPAVLEAAVRLKVVGRAGIGVDNIDVEAATERGVVVMNTPFGNSVTTAEHAISLMLALARQIPTADRSTRAGRWEKNRFMGVELMGKVLGLVGCGNIGSIVADRCHGLKMRVVAYDPFLSPERALDLGVEKVDLDTLLARADFISLHTPLTDQTRNILSRDNLMKTRPGVRLVNCARGGLVDEQAVADLIRDGHIAGAAFDVFTVEPAKESPLFGLDEVVVTPHLGASTSEAQENVALQVAEQISDYLTTGAIVNALNMPSVTAEEAPRLRPYMRLAEQLGSFAGQLTETGLEAVTISYAGHAASLNTRPLTQVVLTGLLRPLLASVNMVNAPAIAKQRNIDVRVITSETIHDYQTLLTVEVVTERGPRAVSGTLFQDLAPRLVSIRGIPVEAKLGPHMLYVRNQDKPGLIGGLGRTLGDAGINIATFHLGRDRPGGDAIALVEVDGPIPDAVLAQVCALPQVLHAKQLSF